MPSAIRLDFPGVVLSPMAGRLLTPVLAQASGYLWLLIKFGTWRRQVESGTGRSAVPRYFMAITGDGEPVRVTTISLHHSGTPLYHGSRPASDRQAI
ncbi:MAG: hypothetical protein CBB77_05375 [Hyphomonas sp. TMED17]|nr:MAG: hypothetical protein CBB77_05375 [Hyphomonas sp. TMED17]